MSTLLFVYGTLKRGQRNHHFLSGQKFLGEATTAPGFVLFEIADFPGMTMAPAEPGEVTGEVWSVDSLCLQRLDELEGLAEGLYRRETVSLRPPFADANVQTYVYARGVEGRRRLGSTW